VKRDVKLSALSRERRNRGRGEVKAEASRRSVATRSLRREPSRRFRSWERKDPAAWNGRDALGFYASTYLAEVGSEDPELFEEASVKRCASALAALVRDLAPGESPRDFLAWAVAECRTGRGYPRDGVPSVVAVTYRRILLKRWRATSGAAPDGVAPRSREWVEG